MLYSKGQRDPHTGFEKGQMVKPVQTAGQMLLQGLKNIRGPALQGALENLPAVPITRAKLKKELQNAGVTTNELVNAAQQFEYDPKNFDLRPLGELMRSLVGSPTKADKKVVYQPRDLQPMIQLMRDYKYNELPPKAINPLEVEMRHKRDAAQLKPAPYSIDHEGGSISDTWDWRELTDPIGRRIIDPGSLPFRQSVSEWPVPLEKWPLNVQEYKTTPLDELGKLETEFGKKFEGINTIVYENISFGNRDNLVKDLKDLQNKTYASFHEGKNQVLEISGLPPVSRDKLDIKDAEAEKTAQVEYWADALRGDIDGLTKAEALDAFLDHHIKYRVIPQFRRDEKYDPHLTVPLFQRQFNISRDGVESVEDMLSRQSPADLDFLKSRDIVSPEGGVREELHLARGDYEDRLKDAIQEKTVQYFQESFPNSRKHVVKQYPQDTDFQFPSWSARSPLKKSVGWPEGGYLTLPSPPPMKTKVFDTSEDAVGYAFDQMENKAKKSFANIVPYENRISLGYEADPKVPPITETWGGTKWNWHNLTSEGPRQGYSESVYVLNDPRQRMHSIFTEPHWSGATGSENVFGHTRQTVGRPLLYESPDARVFQLEELQPQFAQTVHSGPGTLEKPLLFNTPDATNYLRDMRDVSGFPVNVDPAARMSLDEITELKPPRPERIHGLDGFTYTLTHPILKGQDRKKGIPIYAENLDDARKQFAVEFNNQQINHNLTSLTESGFFTPHPYAYTNPAEQFLARGALQQAIDSGADFMTWPMRGKEFARRNPDNPDAVRGQRAEYNRRLVNYYNKLGKPYGVKVGHDRVITQDDPSVARKAYELFKSETAGGLSDPHWKGRYRNIGKQLVEESAFSETQPLERVHKLDIRPMRDIFKKGIPLSITGGGVLSHPAFNYGEEQ